MIREVTADASLINDLSRMLAWRVHTGRMWCRRPQQMTDNELSMPHEVTVPDPWLNLEDVVEAGPDLVEPAEERPSLFLSIGTQGCSSNGFCI
jgi:hypothetical protein